MWLEPFAMYLAFPGSDYYGSSALCRPSWPGSHGHQPRPGQSSHVHELVSPLPKVSPIPPTVQLDRALRVLMATRAFGTAVVHRVTPGCRRCYRIAALSLEV